VPDEFPLSVISACELFGLFITLSKGDLENPVSKAIKMLNVVCELMQLTFQSIEKCLQIITERAQKFLKSLKDGRDRLPKFFLPSLRNGGVSFILIISYCIINK